MATQARAVGGWIGQVLAWTVILAIGAVLVIAVVLPRVSGAVAYTVLSGSMRPGMPEGSLVVVRPTDPDRIAIGDVLTYQLESGRPTVVTHRVTAVSSALDGDRFFTTQGDANSTPDAAVVLPEQVIGVRWYHVPLLGYVNTLVSGDQRQVVLGLVVTGLLGYAAFMFIGSWRDRAAERRVRPGPDVVAR
ncbi:signal peptidase I [Microbacterium stercoris]|uniref:Signal peptidase I n=1 Tax=Microbacterium stercoris TaxID=2820289 RepID=A0A939QMT4_9MICO|nr:signal peptidase I [Microbacterium stercoris]MBO3665105.1 signal peptidase I [Microbacterium stercoris]